MWAPPGVWSTAGGRTPSGRGPRPDWRSTARSSLWTETWPQEKERWPRSSPTNWVSWRWPEPDVSGSEKAETENRQLGGDAIHWSNPDSYQKWNIYHHHLLPNVTKDGGNDLNTQWRRKKKFVFFSTSSVLHPSQTVEVEPSVRGKNYQITFQHMMNNLC